MIRLVVAYAAEARALIDYFKLKRLHDQNAFVCYRGQETTADIWLIVSGPGKLAAVAATAHLQGLSGFQRDQIWLNLGIAGHRDLPLGTARLCHKIIDVNSQTSYYPQLVAKSPWPSETVHTLTQPEQHYLRDGLLDLEASGFFQAALRYSSSELIHAVKVVSDNAAQPWHAQAGAPSKDSINQLLAPLMPALADFSQALAPLSAQLQDDLRLTQASAHYQEALHFTHSQQQQLQQQLRAWLALAPHSSAEALSALHARSATELLSQLAQRLRQVAKARA